MNVSEGEGMPIWVYFFVGFIALMVVANVFRRRHIQRIVASRTGESFDTFRSSFTGEAVQEEVLKAVYVVFQQWIGDVVDEFPVRAADNIGKIYEMVDEDLEDAILQVVNKLGRRLPDKQDLSKVHPVVTVKDFARFVAACPLASVPPHAIT